MAAYTIEIASPENSRDIEMVADMMAETFIEREPLTHALVSTNPALRDIFRSFSLDVSSNVAKVGTIYFARDSGGLIIGFIMTAPSAKDAYPTPPPAGLEPWYDILDGLDVAFRKRLQLNPNLKAPSCAIELVMGGVHKDHEGQRIMPKLVRASLLAAREQGYREVVAKATSRSQVIIQAGGCLTLAEISYKDYQYNGTRPFASIKWPETAKLMWGSIEQGLAIVNPLRSTKL